MPTYVIRQGDYLTKLAVRMGFDADAVWNHDDNRELREKRPNREILHPGDVLHLPEPEADEGVDLTHESRNTYRARVPTVSVPIVLRRGDRALANEPYVVDGLGPRETHGTTDGDGKLTLVVPVYVSEVRLRLNGGRTVLPVWIGHMDPVSELSGVRARLNHLRIPTPTTTGVAQSYDEEVARLAPALREFQRQNGLEQTGVLNDETRDALQRAHGS